MKNNTILKRARLEKGLSQRQIADALDVAETTVGRWEAGKATSLPLDKMKVLSDTLCLPIELLICSPDDPSIPPICWELLGPNVLIMTRTLRILGYDAKLIDGRVVVSGWSRNRADLTYSKDAFLQMCDNYYLEGIIGVEVGRLGDTGFSQSDLELFNRLCSADPNLKQAISLLLTYGEGRTNVYQDFYDAQRKKEVHQGEDQGGA